MVATTASTTSSTSADSLDDLQSSSYIVNTARAPGLTGASDLTAVEAVTALYVRNRVPKMAAGNPDSTAYQFLRTADPLENGGGNWRTFKLRTEQALGLSDLLALVTNDGDTKPDQPGPLLEAWNGRERRACALITSRLGDEELQQVVGLNAPEAWAFLRGKFELDINAIYKTILSTLGLLKARTTAEVHYFLQQHEKLLAEARKSNFRLVDAPLATATNEEKARTRALNMCYSIDILAGLPPTAEWKTFSQIYDSDPSPPSPTPSSETIFQGSKKEYGLPRISTAAGISAALLSPSKRQVLVAHVHRAYGHPGKEAMCLLLKTRDLEGFTIADLDAFFAKTCSSCILGKSTRLPFPPSGYKPKLALESVSVDTAGPFKHKSFSGMRYFIVVVDGASGWIGVEPMKKKTEVTAKVASLLNRLEDEFRDLPRPSGKSLISDNGTEYTSSSFKKLLRDRGYAHRLSVPYSPQQNGRAERAVRAVKEKTTTLLSDAGLSPRWWAEVIFYATFLLNNLPSLIGGVSPYRFATGKNHSFLGSHAPVLGQTVFANNPDAPTFEEKAVEGIFLGVGAGRGVKGVRFPPKGRPDGQGTRWERNVYFTRGDVPSVKRRDLSDDDVWEGGIEEQGEEAGEQQGVQPAGDEQPNADRAGDDLSGGGDAEQLDAHRAGDDLSGGGDGQPDEDRAGDEEVLRSYRKNGHDYVVEAPEDMSTGALARKYAVEGKRKRQARILATVSAPSFLDDEVDTVLVAPAGSGEVQTALLVRGGGGGIDRKGRAEPTTPTSTADALSGPYGDEWRTSIGDEFEGFQLQNAWELVPPPEEKVKTVGSRLAHTIRRHEEGIAEQLKSRLVIQGLKTFPFLQQYGPSYAPLPTWTVISIFHKLVVDNGWKAYLTDLVKGYLAADAAEGDDPLYIRQPAGFKQKGKEDWVFLLRRAVYGLPQSGRQLHVLILTWLTSVDFVAVSEDATLYVGTRNGKKMAIVVYVDDAEVAGPDKTVCDFLAKFSEQFDVKVRGKLDGGVFLGRQIKHDEEGGTITVRVTSHIDRLARAAGLEHVKPLHLPIQPGVPYTAWDGEPVDKPEYLSLVGLVLFISHTRPDVQFAASILSRYSQNPGQEHWKLLRRTITYLYTTRMVGLRTTRSESGSGELKVQAFVDSDFAGDEVTRRSTTGGVVQVDGSTVMTFSRRQPAVSLSTYSAEINAISTVSVEAEWVDSLVVPLRDVSSPTIVLFNDNLSAVNKLRSATFAEQVPKHVDVKAKRLSEQIQQGFLSLSWIPGEENPADLLTKPLSAKRARALGERIGLVGWPDGRWGSR
ncbi:hypothetical protein JCM8097_002115 [Rhodosporidiobolus ruineniae]